MKRIIFLILIILIIGGKNVKAQNFVCCQVECPSPLQSGCFWTRQCIPAAFTNMCWKPTTTLVSEVPPSSTATPLTPCRPCPFQGSQPTPPRRPELETKPGQVTITWKEKQIKICPPGIFGSAPCEYPDIQTIVEKFIDFVLKISPPILVILLIVGGFTYMLSVFKPEIIKLGHSYIQWAVYGYVILLLISLIFTFISAIFGGPKL